MAAVIPGRPSRRSLLVATAAAGGVLAGLSIREAIEGVDSARTLLSKYAAPGVPIWAAHGLLDVDRIAREACARQRLGAA